MSNRHDLLPAGPGWPLTAAEERLVACAASGRWWFPGENVPPELYDDPREAERWSDDRILRAEVIYCLMTGTPWDENSPPWPLHPHGIVIVNARIDGLLNFRGCELCAPFSLHSCVIDEPLFLVDAVARTIVLDGSRLSAVKGWRLSVHGDLSLRKVWVENGELNFCGAALSGQFLCSDSVLSNLSEDVLSCVGMSVGADARLDGVLARGNISFARAKIGGDLSLSRAVLSGREGFSLNGESMTVGANILLNDGFRSRSCVRFSGAKIGGRFDCTQGIFESSPEGGALDLRGLEANHLHFGKVGKVVGDVRLTQGVFHALCDDGSANPLRGHLYLDGAVYDRFIESPTDWKSRTAWLKGQPEDHLAQGFKPQPWTQLIKVLRDMGHETDARMVAIERERVWWARRRNNWVKRLGAAIASRFLRWTVGYGYQPWKALVWSLVFIIGGWFVFQWAYSLGYISPRDGSVIVYLDDARNSNPKNPPPHYSRFNAFAYAADVFLPVVELGQDSAWQTSFPVERNIIKRCSAAERAQPLATCSVTEFFERTGAYLFDRGAHRIVYWLEEGFGWILTSLFVAGLSGAIKRD